MGERVPPDGGCLAWMIVAASFMVSFLQVLKIWVSLKLDKGFRLTFSNCLWLLFEDGFRDSFGLLLPSISSFYSVGRASAALTSSLMTSLTLGSGPLAAWLLLRWGHRSVTLVGTLLAAGGLAAAGVGVHFQVTNIGLLYVTVSTNISLLF